MGRGWDLAETESSSQRTGETKSGEKCPTQCGLCGFAIGEKRGAGQEGGYDGGKKVNGRKRTILVDTMGLLLCAVVHSAKRSDQKGMTLLALWFASLWQSLQLIWTDSTFGGKVFTAWIKETFGWTLEVVKKKEGQKGFEVLPKRWVVERTFAWFGRYRRLSKDYEYLPTTSETMLYAAMVNLMLRRLA